MLTTIVSFVTGFLCAMALAEWSRRERPAAPGAPQVPPQSVRLSDVLQEMEDSERPPVRVIQRYADTCEDQARRAYVRGVLAVAGKDIPEWALERHLHAGQQAILNSGTDIAITVAHAYAEGAQLASRALSRHPQPSLEQSVRMAVQEACE